MTEDAYYLEKRQEALSEFQTDDNGGGMMDSLSIAIKYAIKNKK